MLLLNQLQKEYTVMLLFPLQQSPEDVRLNELGQVETTKAKEIASNLLSWRMEIHTGRVTRKHPHSDQSNIGCNSPCVGGRPSCRLDSK